MSTHPTILADRANADQDRILSSVVPILNITSGMLQQHLFHAFDNSHKFGIKTFLRSHLQAHLTSLMVAAHLAGMRRAALMEKDSRSGLELSVFRNVVNFVRKRTKLNIDSLRKKYEGLSFRIINSVSDDINSDINKTIADLIANGSHIREAKQVLAAKFAQYGIRPTSKSNLETIFRTQTQIAFAAGKWKSEHSDPDIEGILWGYRYVTVGDDRVRPTHAILDGTTLPKSDEWWTIFYPPNGYNCRCQAIPLFEPAHIVYPPSHFEGVKIKPDKGFNFNAGSVFNPMSA